MFNCDYESVEFWPFWGRRLEDVRVLPHPKNSSILVRPQLFSVVRSTFLAEEEAQNLEILPHPKFGPLWGPLVTP